jgi:hypothetical protein
MTGIMSGYPLLSQTTIADCERKEAAPANGTALVAVKVDHERTR